MAARTLCWTLLIGLLSGCSALRTAEAPAELTRWSDFQAEQLARTHWRLEGKLGIRTPGQAQSAYLNWRQQAQHYRMNLTGPLGQGAVRIVGGPEQIELARGDERHLARSAEALLQEQLGWQLPLDSLPYWVRGIPDPDYPFLATFNPEQRLESLRQQGWEVLYRRYRQFDSGYLPDKLLLTHGQLRLTLLIRQWESG